MAGTEQNIATTNTGVDLPPFNWRKYEVKITDDFAQPEPILTQGEGLILSRGNIMCIIGKAKSYKTFLCTSIVSGLEDDYLTLHLDESVNRVLYIDTEQAQYHVQNLIRRIYRTCDWDTSEQTDKIIVLALRPLSTQERLNAVRTVIDEVRPDLCIIDGIRDLLVDFNDLKESANVVNELMKWSHLYNCGIITVIHQNKGDKNARGHCGSELVNKSETVLEVVNTEGVATVSPAYSRNMPMQDFSFRIIQGLPELCAEPKIVKKHSELKEKLQKIMFGVSWITKPDLKKTIAEKAKKSQKTAGRWIDEAIEAKILLQNNAGYLYLATEDEEQEEMPF